MNRNACSCAYGPATSWRHEPHCQTRGQYCEDCATTSHTAVTCTNTSYRWADGTFHPYPERTAS